MTKTQSGPLRPAVPWLRISEDGTPELVGYRCHSCGETYLSNRRACARCFAVQCVRETPLAVTGKLYNFTIVERSFPGVEVPFISAIVDLDGGGTLMGNLLETPFDAGKIKFDMPVEVVFREASKSDKAGNRYLAYFFIPRRQP